MIEKLIIVLIERIGPRLITEALEWIFEADAGRDIDKRLETFKAAVRKAFDGKDVTTEQRKELNDAISDFIRGTNRL